MKLLHTPKPDVELVDQLGFADPFGLKQTTSQLQDKEPLPTFKEVLAQHQLTPIAIEKSNGHESDHTLIPNQAHFIYIINPLTDKDKLDTIKIFKKFNPDYAVTLWVDIDRYTDEQKAELFQWSKNENIHLLDVSSVLADHMGETETLYKLEHARRAPGAASDILRLHILKFGGIYSDVDILCKNKLGNIHAKNGLLLNIGEKDKIEDHPLVEFKNGTKGRNALLRGDTNFHFSKGKQEKKISWENINNDYISARPQHPALDYFVDQSRQARSKTADELFAGELEIISQGRKQTINYKKDKFGLLTADFLRAYTVSTTGPNLIANFVVKNKQNAAEYIEPNYDKITFGYEGSWMPTGTKKPYNVNDEEAIKIVLTSILDDLRVEPHILRLDMYDRFLDENRTLTVLHLLNEYYPAQFKAIVVIRGGFQLSKAETEKVLNLKHDYALPDEEKTIVTTTTPSSPKLNKQGMFDKNNELVNRCKTLREKLTAIVDNISKSQFIDPYTKDNLKLLYNDMEKYAKYLSDRDITTIFNQANQLLDCKQISPQNQIETALQLAEYRFEMIEKFMTSDIAALNISNPEKMILEKKFYDVHERITQLHSDIEVVMKKDFIDINNIESKYNEMMGLLLQAENICLQSNATINKKIEDFASITQSNKINNEITKFDYIGTILINPSDPNKVVLLLLEQFADMTDHVKNSQLAKPILDPYTMHFNKLFELFKIYITHFKPNDEITDNALKMHREEAAINLMKNCIPILKDMNETIKHKANDLNSQLTISVEEAFKNNLEDKRELARNAYEITSNNKTLLNHLKSMAQGLDKRFTAITQYTNHGDTAALQPKK